MFTPLEGGIFKERGIAALFQLSKLASSVPDLSLVQKLVSLLLCLIVFYHHPM